jgi:hypothetical protein
MASIYGQNDPQLDKVPTKTYMVFNLDGTFHSGHKPEYISPSSFGEHLIVIEWGREARMDKVYTLDLETKRIIEEDLIMPPEMMIEDAFHNLRDLRNDKLKATDWSQAGDVPQALKEKYQTYRQQLRDLPSTVATLEEVENLTWPAEPD